MESIESDLGNWHSLLVPEIPEVLLFNLDLTKVFLKSVSLSWLSFHSKAPAMDNLEESSAASEDGDGTGEDVEGGEDTSDDEEALKIGDN